MSRNLIVFVHPLRPFNILFCCRCISLCIYIYVYVSLLWGLQHNGRHCPGLGMLLAYAFHVLALWDIMGVSCVLTQKPRRSIAPPRIPPIPSTPSFRQPKFKKGWGKFVSSKFRESTGEFWGTSRGAACLGLSGEMALGQLSVKGRNLTQRHLPSGASACPSNETSGT